MLRSKIVKRALQQGFSGRSRCLLHNLGLTFGQDIFWRLAIVAKAGLISKNIKEVINPQLLIIKHGTISDHQTNYPTAMSEGKKRDI